MNRYDYDAIAGLNITPSFADVYPDYEQFKADYEADMFPRLLADITNLKTIYYLLYARYGNEEVYDGLDLNQWRAKVMSIIFQYAPAWEKKLEIQKEIRSWSKEDIITGAADVYNSALHPGKALSPEGDGIVKAINSQNVNYRKKDKMSAYSYLSAILDTDITEEFLVRFKPLFNPFAGIKSRIEYYETEV